MVLEDDPGASADYQEKFEANLGAGLGLEGEFKIQVTFKGQASILAVRVASVTAIEDSDSLTLSGLVTGRAECTSGIELQLGVGSGTKIGETQNWTNTKRTIVILHANENDAICY